MLITHLLYLAQTNVSLDTTPLPNTPANHAEISTGLDIIFTITGALALLVMTIGGFRYILSRGDPQATAQAKDTILYASVGLIISITAFAIVNFVVAKTT
jgi:hypothetical protein